MSRLVEALFSAQNLLLERGSGTAKAAFVLRHLADRVPPKMLAHFLRFIAQGRPGVAVVRGGACSECALPVAPRVQLILAESQSVRLCDRCECFLLLDPDRPRQRAQIPDYAACDCRGSGGSDSGHDADPGDACATDDRLTTAG